MEFFCLLFIGGIVASLFFFWNNNRLNDQWLQAATELRLQFRKEGFSDRTLTGNRAGMKVVVSTFVTTEDNKNQRYTSYYITFRDPLGFDLALEKQTASHPQLRNELVLGDPLFDPKFIVLSSNEDETRRYLDPDRRRLLTQVAKRFDDYEISPSGINVASKVGFSNADALIRNVTFLLETADQLGEFETTPAVPPRIPVAVPEPEKAELDPDAVIELKPAIISEATVEAAEISASEVSDAIEAADSTLAAPTVREITAPVAPVIAEAIIEAESAHDDGEESGEAPLETEPEKEVKEIKTVVVSDSPETPTNPEVEEKVELDDEFEQLCSELFDSGMSRFETGRSFDQSLKGQHKSGHGILRRVDKFTNDLVFGRGPGTIAQIELLSLDGGKSATAVVQFSERESISALKDKLGEQVSFSGTLVKCDAFDQKLYVAQ